MEVLAVPPAKRGGKIFYGWVIVAAGFTIGFAGIGARYSYGIFLHSIETDFAMTRGAASGIFSVYMLLCCLLAFFDHIGKFIRIKEFDTVFEFGKDGNDLRMMREIMEGEVGLEQVVRRYTTDLEVVSHQ